MTDLIPCNGDRDASTIKNSSPGEMSHEIPGWNRDRIPFHVLGHDISLISQHPNWNALGHSLFRVSGWNGTPAHPIPGKNQDIHVLRDLKP